nr:hypothetical protein Q903MT_gene3611 [Picea sitchensis]
MLISPPFPWDKRAPFPSLYSPPGFRTGGILMLQIGRFQRSMVRSQPTMMRRNIIRSRPKAPGPAQPRLNK